MTSLLFITEVLSLQSEAVSFTKGFMWAGVIKALLDLHCLFRVIWREYNRCFSRRQSATTFRNCPWKSRSKWIQQVSCRIPLGWDCSWSQRRSSFLELWLHSCSIKDCKKMLGIECWSILWLQWANLTTVLPTNSTWAWEVLCLKQYKMCFANITAEKPYHSLQTFHLLKSWTCCALLPIIYL